MAPTLTDVADVVNVAYCHWQMIGAAIEATRLGAKAAIDMAETVDGAKAIATAIIWPAPSMLDNS